MATAMTSDVLSGLGLRSVQDSQAKTNDKNKLNSGDDRGVFQCGI